MKYIILTSGNKVKVDDFKYNECLSYTWLENNNGYAYRKDYLGKIDGKYKYKSVLMHRWLTNAPRGKSIDHINGDSLDNRISNLRLCLNSENVRNAKRICTNTSGYKGVSWDKVRNKWTAYIYHGKSINLGGYDLKEEAALAYDVAAKKYFGEYARTNFK